MAPSPRVLLALLFVLPAAADAANRDTFPLGNQAALTAGAVTATVTDGGALFYNPAGIASHRRQRFSVNGSATMLVIRPRTEVVTTNIVSDDSTSTTNVQLLSAPTAGTFSMPLARNLSLSAGSFVRVRDNVAQDVRVKGLVPNSDMPAAVSVDLTGYEDEMLFAAGLGWQPTGWLRLGVAGYATIGTKERQGGTVISAGEVLQFNDDSPNWPSGDGGGIERLEYEDSITRIGFEGALGVQLHPIAGLRLGVMVRTHRVRIYESGQRRRTYTRFWGTRDEQPGTGQTGPPMRFEIEEEEGEGFRVREARAPRLAFGVGYEGLRWSLAFDVDHTFAQEKKGLGDTSVAVTNLRLGGTVRANDVLWLGGGLFTDRTGRESIDTVLDESLDYYGGHAGIWMRTPVSLRQDERAEDIVFSSVIALRYAAGVGSVGRQDVQLSTDPADFTALQTALTETPDLESVVFHEIALHIGSSLEF
jgi:hypothetical protein